MTSSTCSNRRTSSAFFAASVASEAQRRRPPASSRAGARDGGHGRRVRHHHDGHGDGGRAGAASSASRGRRRGDGGHGRAQSQLAFRGHRIHRPCRLRSACVEHWHWRASGAASGESTACWHMHGRDDVSGECAVAEGMRGNAPGLTSCVMVHVRGASSGGVRSLAAVVRMGSHCPSTPAPPSRRPSSSWASRAGACHPWRCVVSAQSCQVGQLGPVGHSEEKQTSCPSPWIHDDPRAGAGH